ncbi:MAG: hypothetical protein ACUVRY_07125 [Thermoanaerobaculaceae bacterium]
MRQILLVLGVATLVACGDGAKEPKTVRITVPCSKTWTETSVKVRPGQSITVTAEGQLHAGDFTLGPEGTTAHPEWAAYSLVPDWPHLALIGKLGEDGEPFLIGTAYSGTVVRGGVLYLGINDLDAENNAGTFQVTVEIR